MAMDAAWKVYVGDRRFDDDQISNLYIKLKYQTVGRFTFDYRPIDGDDEYMEPNRTLRIFWGDIHKLDGVIQRRDWDATQQCYHVFGADLRGFLLDRVNSEPATVSSYTSDVSASLMYEGCDFPSNIWAGAGDQIGTYTFHYKLGIQNTIRITGAAENRWYFHIERGTVYDFVDGCIMDATKHWDTNMFQGATLRFVSGACKNKVYNVCGNSSNKVCLRLATETCRDFGTADESRWKQFGTDWYYDKFGNNGFEDGTIGPFRVATVNVMSATYYATLSSPGYESDTCCHIYNHDLGFGAITVATNPDAPIGSMIEYNYRWHREKELDGVSDVQITVRGAATEFWPLDLATTQNPSYPDWDYASHSITTKKCDSLEFIIGDVSLEGSWMEIDNLCAWVATDSGPASGGFGGTIPGCARRGDTYEIVYWTMERIVPPPISFATLMKDIHIVLYNKVNDLSTYTTAITVRG